MRTRTDAPRPGRRNAASLPVGIAALYLLTAAPTDARCLTSAWVLGDQRAIVAWRAAVETACPCAGYSGAPGLDRQAYRRCAEAVLHATVASGGLRRACSKTARTIYKGATCGTDRVACGQLRPSSSRPVRCEVATADRCVSSPTLEQHACSGNTHCADVVDWTAGSCEDPRVSGPFAPGYTIVTFSKPSVLDPTQVRSMDTVIWYPAVPGSGPIDPTYGGVRDAALDPSAGPYPLVPFSHGSCGRPWQSTFLWALVATRGFIVAAPPHPGNTVFDQGCDAPDVIAAAEVERPEDIRHVVDEMLALDQSPESSFFGAIDETRVAMTGYSFGGFTSYLAVQEDTRFSAAVLLAPTMPQTLPELTVPSLTMRSRFDQTGPPWRIAAAYGQAPAPKYLVDLDNTGHFAYVDSCLLDPDCGLSPGMLTRAESHAAVLRWVVPFLEAKLAGDTRYEAFLLAAPPGSLLQHEP